MCLTTERIEKNNQSLKWNVKLRKTSIFNTSYLLLLIKVLWPQKLLMTFVLCMERVPIALGTARGWYAKFKNGNFDLKDAPRSGRPVEFDEERLNQLLHKSSRQTTRELAEKMECSHTAIEKHLHSMGKVPKYGVWVLHALSDNNKNQRATISAGLLARHHSTHGHKQRFLYRIVTGDEKWCLYINMKQCKEWLSKREARSSSM
ncbi:histone-lysine N-methyltransferase SETMAR-like [Octopus bimaculoides]|uniref:histone-lysine N-methyltransferase SETMAR-like n=1 Tax=Octopus bimaculoides TaxID=37653 RepID=UPI0022DEA15A|nr:histone-lysine N-methyltransferase SETMAR-like [Octopus bimaculoides]